MNREIGQAGICFPEALRQACGPSTGPIDEECHAFKVNKSASGNIN